MWGRLAGANVNVTARDRLPVSSRRVEHHHHHCPFSRLSVSSSYFFSVFLFLVGGWQPPALPEPAN